MIFGKRIFRAIRFGIVLQALIFSCAMSADLRDGREASDSYWNSERAKFLDDKVTLNALVEARSATDASQKTSSAIAEEINQLLLAELADHRGVHIETALTTIGALAGFSCQMAIREGFIATGSLSKEKAFNVIETKNGEKYYTGALINECLVARAEGNFSVWGFVGAAPQSLGKDLPDIRPIFSRTASNLGSSDFGKPGLPERHMPLYPANDLLWKFWNISRNTLVANSQAPEFWPFVLGEAAQKLILQGQNAIDPTLASQIVMEAAIPMSQIDPAKVEYAHFKKYAVD